MSFDLSLARGLDYYTGLIYEAVLIGETLNEERDNSHKSVSIPQAMVIIVQTLLLARWQRGAVTMSWWGCLIIKVDQSRVLG